MSVCGPVIRGSPILLLSYIATGVTCVYVSLPWERTDPKHNSGGFTVAMIAQCDDGSTNRVGHTLPAAAAAHPAAFAPLPASCQQGVPRHSSTQAAAAAAGRAAALWPVRPVQPETGWPVAPGGVETRGPGPLAGGAVLCGC